jgi:hypothetical protein
MQDSPPDLAPVLACERDVHAEMTTQGFSSIAAGEYLLVDRLRTSWESLRGAWESLEFDEYYGGRADNQRYRRYTDFAFEPASGALMPLEHTPYFQSERMNRYVGGMTRHFGDILPETYENEFFLELVCFSFCQFPVPEEFARRTWVSQIHQIRITVGPGETTDITPEGIHSDGYPFASVHLVDRVGVAGGVSSVYSYDEQELASLTFEQPLDSLFLEDRKLKHYVTPIHGSGKDPGYRSILAISFSLPDSPFTTDV